MTCPTIQAKEQKVQHYGYCARHQVRASLPSILSSLKLISEETQVATRVVILHVNVVEVIGLVPILSLSLQQIMYVWGDEPEVSVYPSRVNK